MAYNYKGLINIRENRKEPMFIRGTRNDDQKITERRLEQF